jgi:hypothetical protein
MCAPEEIKKFGEKQHSGQQFAWAAAQGPGTPKPEQINGG